MMIWRRGQSSRARRLAAVSLPMDQFLAGLDASCSARVPGTGVFVTGHRSAAPPVLVHFLNHTRALPERVFLVTMLTLHVPRVPLGEGAEVETLGHGFYRALIRSGFMEDPQLPQRLIKAAAAAGVSLNLAETTFFVGHETFLATARGEMGPFTETVFSFLYDSTGSVAGSFGLPPERVVVIGLQLDP
jgi:KUP system potassium uptake protein